MVVCVVLGRRKKVEQAPLVLDGKEELERWIS
jgi:hypothetical protein